MMSDHSEARTRDAVAAVSAHIPEYRVRSVARAGAGYDHVAYEVNGELIVRFGKDADQDRRAARVGREARLLEVLGAVSSLTVPAPAFVAPELGCMAYYKLPGSPLADMSPAPRSRHSVWVAAALGEFLSLLHAVPVTSVADLVEVDDYPIAEWRNEAAEAFVEVTAWIPAPHRRGIEAFLDSPPPSEDPSRVLSHGDLGIEHVLVKPNERVVSGVIGWGEAAIADPAFDFGLLCRDLGPAAVDMALARYGGEARDIAALRRRAHFYARCSVFEDMVHGLETGDPESVAESMTALRRLFPATAPRIRALPRHPFAPTGTWPSTLTEAS